MQKRATALSTIGDQEKTNEAEQAARNLPDLVDTQPDAAPCERFGLNRPRVATRFAGGEHIPGL